MAAHTQFGGHFVPATWSRPQCSSLRAKYGNSQRGSSQLPPPTAERSSPMSYRIEKGYMCVDGTSSTLTAVSDEARTFRVMRIAHTGRRRPAAQQVGQKVDVEVDMVEKYVEKTVLAALGGEEGVEGRVETLGDKGRDIQAIMYSVR